MRQKTRNLQGTNFGGYACLQIARSSASSGGSASASQQGHASTTSLSSLHGQAQETENCLFVQEKIDLSLAV